MYRDDDDARAERAKLLIDEIAGLEREKLAAAAADRRLEGAKRELAALQSAPSAPSEPAEPAPQPPGIVTHIAVFCVAACATFAGYTLLF
jgi:hypothetical protein